MIASERREFTFMRSENVQPSAVSTRNVRIPDAPTPPLQLLTCEQRAASDERQAQKRRSLVFFFGGTLKGASISASNAASSGCLGSLSFWRYDFSAARAGAT